MRLTGIILLLLISKFGNAQSSIDSLWFSPNPFCNLATIHFEVSDKDSATLLMFGMTGKVVKTFFADTLLDSGSYTLNYSFDSLNEGVYIITLKFGLEKWSRRVVKECSSTIGLGEHTEKRLSVNPNPSNGLFTVEYFLKTESIVNITLYDMTGKKVSNETSKKQPGLQRDIVNQELAKGIYFMQLQVNGSIYNTKILIQ